jgi:hypothetical protein
MDAEFKNHLIRVARAYLKGNLYPHLDPAGFKSCLMGLYNLDVRAINDIYSSAESQEISSDLPLAI